MDLGGGPWGCRGKPGACLISRESKVLPKTVKLTDKDQPHQLLLFFFFFEPSDLILSFSFG